MTNHSASISRKRKRVLYGWAKEVMIEWAEIAAIGLSRGPGLAKDAFPLGAHHLKPLRTGKSPGFDEDGLFEGRYVDLGREGKNNVS
jgi:hypothetical protein